MIESATEAGGSAAVVEGPVRGRAAPPAAGHHPRRRAGLPAVPDVGGRRARAGCCAESCTVRRRWRTASAGPVEPLITAFRQVVVRRGEQAMAPGDLLPLALPQDDHGRVGRRRNEPPAIDRSGMLDSWVSPTRCSGPSAGSFPPTRSSSPNSCRRTLVRKGRCRSAPARTGSRCVSAEPSPRSPSTPAVGTRRSKWSCATEAPESRWSGSAAGRFRASTRVARSTSGAGSAVTTGGG